MTRQSIELPETIKEGHDKMATDFGMTQNDLINLAVTTMVVIVRCLPVNNERTRF